MEVFMNVAPIEFETPIIENPQQPNASPADEVLRSIAAIRKNSLAASSTQPPQKLTMERIKSSPSLVGEAPKSPSFSPDGARIVFLQGKPENAAQNDLWEYDLTANAKRLLVDSSIFIEKGHVLSEAEKNLQERLRNFDQGIVSYIWSNHGNALLFPISGKLYYLDLKNQNAGPKCLKITQPDPFDIKFSPSDKYITYVSGQNLYIYSLLEETEQALTVDGKDHISNGMAEFIAQEEMERFTGYWWSPDDTQIAFVKFDESAIPITKRDGIDAKGQVHTEEQRYPYAGGPNVSYQVGIATKLKPEIQWIDLKTSQEMYVARVDWLKGGKILALQLLSRDQHILELVFANTETGQPKTVLLEVSPTWVNLHDDLCFLDNSFIWSSERTGFRHLYHYGLDGKLIQTLTSGEWSVKRLVGATEEHVYFEGFAKTVLEKHLYSVEIRSGMPSLKRITDRPGFHSIVMSSDSKYYIDTFSNAATPPQVSVHKNDGEHVFYLEANKLDEAHPFYPYLANFSRPIFDKIQANDGQDLYYRLIPPVNFDSKKKYPVIVITYGGPHHRLVANQWMDKMGYWAQIMSQKGYIIFTLDNRGSNDRGKKFEDPIYKKLGDVEVEDQKTGAKFLQTLPFVDADRIGIFGWSYGGYMVLMTMFKAWEIFKTGVAVSPVTEWGQYDTGYTERYLGQPKDNPKGYEESSVIAQVKGKKDKVGRVLIMHGTADDNVLFSNTVRLISELIKEGIRFDTMIYPGSKHAIAEKESNIDVFNRATEHFVRYLAKKNGQD